MDVVSPFSPLFPLLTPLVVLVVLLVSLVTIGKWAPLCILISSRRTGEPDEARFVSRLVFLVVLPTGGNVIRLMVLS